MREPNCYEKIYNNCVRTVSLLASCFARFFVIFDRPFVCMAYIYELLTRIEGLLDDIKYGHLDVRAS